MAGVLIRGGGDTEGNREKSHMETEAEWSGAFTVQGKLGPPAVGRGRKGPPLQPSEGAQPTDPSTLTTSMVREWISVVVGTHCAALCPSCPRKAGCGGKHGPRYSGQGDKGAGGGHASTWWSNKYAAPENRRQRDAKVSSLEGEQTDRRKRQLVLEPLDLKRLLGLWGMRRS